jgi:ATP-dependent RNA helicase DDX3X
MFSATFPPQVLRLASYYMRAPPHAARVICGRVGSTVANIKQVLIETPHLREQKLPYLLRVLEAVEAKRENDGEDVGLTLIFCKQKGTAEWLRQQIVEVTPSLAVEELHGSLTQGARLRALDAFATGAAKILVATDVAARGLDMPDVNHVINFDMPTKKSEFDDYIHRIGRTGRAGRKGIATSFYIPGFAEDIGNGPIYENLKLVFEETQNELPGWFLQSRDARGSVGGISSAYDRGFKGGRARRF